MLLSLAFHPDEHHPAVGVRKRGNGIGEIIWFFQLVVNSKSFRRALFDWVFKPKEIFEVSNRDTLQVCSEQIHFRSHLRYHTRVYLRAPTKRSRPFGDENSDGRIRRKCLCTYQTRRRKWLCPPQHPLRPTLAACEACKQTQLIQ